MATITITIVDLPDGSVSVRTDAERPLVGRGVTVAEALAMELLGTAFKRNAEVVYDPHQVPAISLALELLDPEGLGFSVTAEVRNRARDVLGRPGHQRERMPGVDIDRVYLTRQITGR